MLKHQLVWLTCLLPVVARKLIVLLTVLTVPLVFYFAIDYGYISRKIKYAIPTQIFRKAHAPD